MEEFGDWIYIIVIVVAGIASFVSSMRKKAQQAEAQNQQREIITTGNDMDDVWDDFIPRAEKAPVKTVKPKHSPFDKQKKQYQTLFDEGHADFQNEETKPIDTVEMQTLITIDDLPAEVDEWRKAFVYQEIFSRKY